MDADRRIYLAMSEWTVASKTDHARTYCHTAREEEGHYHLILFGEIYLMHGTELLCMNCALKRGIVTSDRPVLKERGGT